MTLTVSKEKALKGDSEATLRASEGTGRASSERTRRSIQGPWDFTYCRCSENGGFQCRCSLGYGGPLCELEMDLSTSAQFREGAYLVLPRSLMPHTASHDVETIGLILKVGTTMRRAKTSFHCQICLLGTEPFTKAPPSVRPSCIGEISMKPSFV